MDDLEPRKFTADYPTASCLIGCAILGAVVLLIAVPIGYFLLVWLFQDFSGP
jgi:hypothetical protein